MSKNCLPKNLCQQTIDKEQVTNSWESRAIYEYQDEEDENDEEK